MIAPYSLRRLCSVIALSTAVFSSGVISAEPQNNPEGPLVKIGVVVKDKAGRSVNSLRQDDFLLSEDGSPKAISFFSMQDVPTSYGLVVDATGSMRPVFSAVVGAAKAIVNTGKPGDEAFILRLREGEASIVIDWTADKKSLLDALGGFDHAAGKLSIIDALYSTGDHFRSLQTTPGSNLRRNVLVVITDGRESENKHSLHQLVSSLKALRVQVVVICTYKDPPGAGIVGETVRDKAVQFLKSLAKDTNGYFVFPKSSAELEKAASEALDYERSQYIIGYTPSTGRSDHIDARVRLTGRVSSEGYSASLRPLTK